MVYAFFYPSLSRTLAISAISLFPSWSLSTSRRPCPSQVTFRPSLFVSHIESRGSGRWWWWTRPDGGGYGGGVVGSFVPILLPISFLSLWEGEESPRSRALRTEFIIDRAISLTAPRRSWTEVESSRFCPSLRFYGSVSANGKEESITGITKVRDLLAFLDRAAALDHHIYDHIVLPDVYKIFYHFFMSYLWFFDNLDRPLISYFLTLTWRIFLHHKHDPIKRIDTFAFRVSRRGSDLCSFPILHPLFHVFLFRNPQSLAWFCHHRHTVRDDRGKFAIRLFARAKRKIGAVVRERGRQRKPRWKRKKRWLRRKRKKTCSWEAGKGEDCDGPCVGGVGGSGGRLFFYLSLTLRRERTHTGSAEWDIKLSSLFPFNASRSWKKAIEAYWNTFRGRKNDRMSLDLRIDFAEKGVVIRDFAVQIG